jgi:hypothetical protein
MRRFLTGDIETHDHLILDGNSIFGSIFCQRKRRPALPEGKAMRRRDGSPVLLNDEQPARILGRADGFDEKWLQTLLHDNPKVFPIEQIEPGFGELVPLCMELPLALGGGRTGLLDNLFVTPGGGLVLVETKLWRNPEARRVVVAQSLEYAAAIFRMRYDQLDAAVQKARGSGRPTAVGMFELVAEHDPNVDRAEFHDAVARNLARGRAIVAVLGDGIREEMRSLAALVQGHAGHRFTFALVELAVYQISDTTRVVIPSVLAQTELIERGVVRVEGDITTGVKVEITAVPVPTVADNGGQRMSIGEDEFYEALGQGNPAAPGAVRAFIAKAGELGVYNEFRSKLSLKYTAQGRPTAMNLAVIGKDGLLDTGFALGDAGRRYNEALAVAIGGTVKDNANDYSAVKGRDGKSPNVMDLLPRFERQWLDAMERYIDEAPRERDSGPTPNDP